MPRPLRQDGDGEPVPTCLVDGPGALCAGSTDNVYTSTVNPAGGTVTYLWSVVNGTIQGSDTGATVTVTAGVAGDMVVKLDVTRDDCPSHCEKTVTVNPIPTCQVDGPGTLCAGSADNVYTSTVNPAGGTVTYLWSVVNGTIQGSNTGATVTVTAGAAGDMVVKLDATRNGCPTHCEKTVTVNPVPTCQVDGPGSVCAGSPDHVYTSTVNPAGGTVTYLWSVVNGTIQGSDTGATVTVTAGAAGDMVVKLDATRNGCPTHCEKTVTVNPGATCQVDGPGSVCAGSTDHVYTSTVNPPGGTVTYLWSVVNGTIQGSDTGATVTVTAGVAGDMIVRLDATRNDCPTRCEKTVTVNPIPTCQVDGPNPVCAGSTDNVYTSTVNPGGGTVTYLWSVVNGTIQGSDTGATVTVTAGAAGDMVVKLDATRNGCPTHCEKTVTVNPIPTCQVDGPGSVCAGSPDHVYTSTVNPAGGTVTYLWSVVNGTIQGSDTGATVTVTAGVAGDMIVKLDATRNGCATHCEKTVTVNPGATCQVDGPNPVCAGSTDNVYTSTVNPPGGTVTYLWSVVNGTIQGSDTGATVTVTAGAAGDMIVRLDATRNDCPTRCEKTVTVNPIPTCQVDGPSPVCAGSADNVYTSTVNPGGGSVTYLWSVVNGTIQGSDTGATVTVTAGAAGNMIVKLDATRNGCPTHCEKTVTVDPIPTCQVDGPSPVCAGSTDNVYTSTVNPGGGSVTYLWSVVNGTIQGSDTGATVTVTAGAAGDMVVKLDATRNGCPTHCEKTVTVDPIPTCQVDGPGSVCAGSTDNVYTSTVNPGGGSVTYLWSVVNGTIQGSDTGATVTVTAGVAGDMIVKLDATRNGCPDPLREDGYGQPDPDLPGRRTEPGLCGFDR